MNLLPKKLLPSAMAAYSRPISHFLAVILLSMISIGSPATLVQKNGGPDPIDPARLKDVNDLLNQLKKLRTEVGTGHPKVQELLRSLRLMEEELVFEQTFSERLAAQLQAAEDELRERQKQDWEKATAVQTSINQASDGHTPSLETVELLERDLMTELQRIDWELASESAHAKTASQPESFQADELRLKAQQLTRDAAQLKLKVARERQAKAGGRTNSSDVAGQDAELAVQLLAIELNIAEAHLKAAELELAARKRAAQSVPENMLKSLQARRQVVETQLKALPPKKEMARQLVQVQQSSDQLSQQIRELEMQRFQYQSKFVEQQALLDVVRQALSPQQSTRPAPVPKTID